MGIGRRTFLKTLGKAVAGLAILPGLPTTAKKTSLDVGLITEEDWGYWVVSPTQTRKLTTTNPRAKLTPEETCLVKKLSRVKGRKEPPITIEHQGVRYYVSTKAQQLDTAERKDEYIRHKVLPNPYLTEKYRAVLIERGYRLTKQ